jgi:hypothetical protein
MAQQKPSHTNNERVVPADNSIVFTRVDQQVKIAVNPDILSSGNQTFRETYLQGNTSFDQTAPISASNGGPIIFDATGYLPGPALQVISSGIAQTNQGTIQVTTGTGLTSLQLVSGNIYFEGLSPSILSDNTLKIGTVTAGADIQFEVNNTLQGKFTSEEFIAGTQEEVVIHSGYIRLSERAVGPATVAEHGSVYSKDAGATTHLFYKDSAGTEWQITPPVTGTGAPVDAHYLVLALDPTLTNERLFTPGAGLVGTDGGGGGIYTLALGPSGVTPGTYTYTTVTFDIYGRATFAASGTPPAPADAEYLVLNYHSGLTSERKFTPTSNFTAVDSGANSPYTLDLSNTGVVAGTYTNTTVTVDIKGRITSISSGAGSGGAPSDALFLVLALNGTLTNERRFVPSTGLTAVDSGANADYTLTANLSTGVPFGQTAFGGTAAGDILVLSSTTHASKGLIRLGVSATQIVVDEANARLGVGTITPAVKLEVWTSDASTGVTEVFRRNHSTSGVVSSGTGISDTWYIENSSGAQANAARNTILWQVADTTHTSRWKFEVASSGSMVSLFELGNLRPTSAVSAVLNAVQVPSTTVNILGATAISATPGMNYVTVDNNVLSSTSAVAVTWAATVALSGPPVPSGSASIINNAILRLAPQSILYLQGASNSSHTYNALHVAPHTIQYTGATSQTSLTGSSALRVEQVNLHNSSIMSVARTSGIYVNPISASGTLVLTNAAGLRISPGISMRTASSSTRYAAISIEGSELVSFSTAGAGTANIYGLSMGKIEVTGGSGYTWNGYGLDIQIPGALLPTNNMASARGVNISGGQYMGNSLSTSSFIGYTLAAQTITYVGATSITLGVNGGLFVGQQTYTDSTAMSIWRVWGGFIDSPTRGGSVQLTSIVDLQVGNTNIASGNLSLSSLYYGLYMPAKTLAYATGAAGVGGGTAPIANIYVGKLTVTMPAFTTYSAPVASVYIEAAPEGIAPGPALPFASSGTYPLWIDDGVARFDGAGGIVFESPGTAGAVGAQQGYILVSIQGVGTKKIPYHA